MKYQHWLVKMQRGKLLLVLILFVVALAAGYLSQPGFAGTGGSVVILPSNTFITLDGNCTTGEYSDANIVSFLTDVGTTFVYLKHTWAHTYICFTSLPENGFAAVVVDRDNDGSSLDNSDMIFRVFHNGSSTANFFNQATLTFSGAPPGGFSGARTLTEFGFSAEFMLSREVLGKWQRNIGLYLAYFETTLDFSTHQGWPDNGQISNTQNWGDAYLSTGEVDVLQSTISPTMDGRCDNSEYSDASVQVFPAASGSISAFLKHTTTDLFICLKNMNTPGATFRDEENAVIYLNRAGVLGPEFPGMDDFRFTISYNNAVAARRGDGSWFTSETPTNFQFLRYLNGANYWDAELRIGQSFLRGGWDREILLAVSQENVTYLNERYAWPLGMLPDLPNSYAVAHLFTGSPATSLDIVPLFGSDGSIEVVQTIQDVNNNVVLISGKRTFARVYFNQTTIGGSGVSTTARLYGFKDGISLGLPLTPSNPAGRINIINSPMRANLQDSWYFELPPNWIVPGNLTLQAEANPFHEARENNYTNNIVQTTVTFQQGKVLQLHLRDIQYLRPMDNQLVSIRDIDYSFLESYLRRVFPISGLSTSRAPYFAFGSLSPLRTNINDAVDYVNGLLNRQRSNYGSVSNGWIWYGMVSNSGGFMRGKANGIPGFVASGPTGPTGGGFWDQDNVFGDWYGAHEIGHSLGQHHADYCDAGSSIIEPDFPYPNGQIGGPAGDAQRFMGFDYGLARSVTSAQVVPANWFDVMSYCDNIWISDYAYSGIYQYLRDSSVFPAENLDQAENAEISGDFLSVYGIIDQSTQTAQFIFSSRDSEVGFVPSIKPGDYLLQQLDADGNVLASTSFEPALDTDSPELSTLTFNLVVNWMPGTRRSSKSLR